MSLFSFYWDKRFIYAIVYWILEIFVRLFMYLKWDYFTVSKNNIQNEYVYVVLLNIADLLAGFLALYTYCAFREVNQAKTIGNSNTGKSLQLIYKDQEDYCSKKFFIILFIVSFLDYISRCLYSISYAITGATNEEVSHKLQKDFQNTFDILIRYLISILFLKAVIHKHRIFSIITIIFGFLLLLPADFLLINNDPDKNLRITMFYTGILSFRAIFYPVFDNLCKQLFIHYYIQPENLMFLKGLIESAILAALTPALFFLFRIELEITFKLENIITLIIYTLAAFVKDYFLYKINYHFSPQSVSFLVISESVTGSINEVINFIKVKEKDAPDIILLILELIGVFLIAFSTLVYDEVIIINKWSLDKNVKAKIINRAEDDMKLMMELELFKDSAIESITFTPDAEIKESLMNKNDDFIE